MSTSALSGLSTSDVAGLRLKYGFNALPEAVPERFWQRLYRQFNNPLIGILIVALLIDIGVWFSEGAHGAPFESITILTILLANAFLGVWQESKSEAALQKLKSMATPQSWVLRDGHYSRIPSRELLPGDLIRLEAGERIPADATVTHSQSLMVDESILTGESVPIDKADGDAIFGGTLAVRGQTHAGITATGAVSTMGKLAHLIGSVEDEKTPLEKRINHFGKQIALFVLVLALVILITGGLVGGLTHFGTVFLFAVALAVAAVPESLPAVLTLALAFGLERMAARKAVVRKLSAVEALGSVTLIATDKTGTLTENYMEVRKLDSPNPQQALLAMAIVNDADLESGAGDPLELGLLRYCVAQKLDPSVLRQQYPRISMKPFDAAWKYMRITTLTDRGRMSYLKGAPDVLLERCSMGPEEQSAWREKIEHYAEEGYRTLAVAMAGANDERQAEPDDDLIWLGLILLWDPPRPEIPDAIASAQDAGIRVVMITGDHAVTAKAIGRQIGIDGTKAVSGKELDTLSDQELKDTLKLCSIFARVTPAHKLKIVQCLKQAGEVVAVTGDGVNDAPALKAADVGIAMGQRGSDVSREVADLVLLDDNFRTIVAAIEEGRSIYENIQSFIRTLFSTNLTEVILIGIGAFIAFATLHTQGALLLPLTAAQILWINLITDSLPALALTTDRNPHVMTLPPRSPAAPLLERVTLRFTVSVGLLGGLVALILLVALPLLGFEKAYTQSLIFSFLVLVQLSFVLPARKVHLIPKPNNWIIGALSAGILLQMLALFLPPLASALKLASIDWLMAGIILVATCICWLIAEGISYKMRNRGGIF